MSATFANAATEQLASKALHAAAQLDRLERGKQITPETLVNFVNALKSFPGLFVPSTEPLDFGLDPISSEMFSSAIKSATQKRVDNMADLMSELRSFEKSLRSLDPDLDQDLVKFIPSLKRFCLAIHDFVIRSADPGLVERGVFDYEFPSGS